jgi:hypothetical protein
MSTNPITRDTNCLALLQSREYTKSELLGMMKEPSKRDSKGLEPKCIHCGDRDCYGRCDEQLCNCDEPCKAKSCNSAYLYEKMSVLSGAHPHYFMVKFWCEECERLGCRCCTQCRLYYQCNCYGQLDNEDVYSDGEDPEDPEDDDVVERTPFYTCISCEASIETKPDMKFMRLCSKFYCEDCFHVTSETISEEEVDTYYNTTSYENGCDGWYNPETNTFHIGNWVNNKFIPDMDDNRNIEYYNNM